MPAPPVRPAAPGRNPRLLLGAAVVAAFVLVGAVVGLSFALRGGDGKPTVAAGAALPDAAAVTALFRGIPQHGLVLGSAAAPVTLVEYLDLQCPWCGKFARDTFPDVVTRFVRTGKVRVELRPLDFVGSDSVRGRDALFAAAAQNKAFQFAALLYANQGTENTGWLSDQMVAAAARSVRGLTLGPAGGFAGLAAGIERQRANDGVTGVPTFFVRRTGAAGAGTMLVNPAGSTLEAALRAA